MQCFLLSAVYWFHPLVRLSCFFMTGDMEMSCDEAVLEKMGNEIKQDSGRGNYRSGAGREERLSIENEQT